MVPLKILKVYRIDYPEIEDRIEDEPLGLFIKIRKNGLGLKFNIDNSGQTIDYCIQYFKECNELVNVYRLKLVEVSEQSKLNRLIGQNIHGLYFAFIDAEVKSGKDFQVLNSDVVGVQLLTDLGVFTFYNDADEGKYTFELPKCPSPFLFGGIVWKEASSSFKKL